MSRQLSKRWRDGAGHYIAPPAAVWCTRCGAENTVRGRARVDRCRACRKWLGVPR